MALRAILARQRQQRSSLLRPAAGGERQPGRPPSRIRSRPSTTTRSRRFSLRFLIADDPGAGKTIMAGLILKELQYRGLVNHVLIVAPWHLKYQWQREMKEKFGTTFRLIDRNMIGAHYVGNWLATSIIFNES